MNSEVEYTIVIPVFNEEEVVVANKRLKKVMDLTGHSCELLYVNDKIVEKTLYWLEKEDSDFERLVGYWFCVAAITYLIANFFHYIIF